MMTHLLPGHLLLIDNRSRVAVLFIVGLRVGHEHGGGNETCEYITCCMNAGKQTVRFDTDRVRGWYSDTLRQAFAQGTYKVVKP